MLIFFLVIVIIVTYGVLTNRAIKILDTFGCYGSFVEWFVCFCPIWHLIIYLRHKDVCDFITLKKMLGNLKQQYEIMNKKLNKDY